MLLEETPAVLVLGQLCEHHGHTYFWTCGQKPHLIRNCMELIAIYSTRYHLWFLVYQRVLPQLHLPLDQWSKNTSHPKWQNDQLQYRELRTIRCPGLSTSSSTSTSPASSTSSSQDTVIGTENPATDRSEIISESHGGTRRVDQQKPKTQIKMKTTRTVARCAGMATGFQRESGG